MKKPLNIFLFIRALWIAELLIALASETSVAQMAPPNGYCYTDQIYANLVRHDSSIYYKRKIMDSIISVRSDQMRAGGVSPRSITNAPIIIPTVFYIVNDGTPASNISMQQIQSQMDQLNANYAAFGFQFCYAKKNVNTAASFTPQAGDSAGVFRIQSALTNVDMTTQDAQLKALSNLPAANYLRIYIVNSIAPAGVLGYAFFPGTTQTEDGAVILASTCGSNKYCPSCPLYPDYNLGAVLTHEVGHFLNLYHTFQGGCYIPPSPNGPACQISGDWICDTPPTLGDYGCPSPVPLSCDGITPALINNYMDYTNDSCKNAFTQDQSIRMYQAVLAYRQTLISTINLINTGIICASLNGQYATFSSGNFDGCVNDTMVFTSLNANGFTYQWNFGDGTASSGPTGSHAYSSAGQFLVTCQASDSSSGISENSSMPVFITACSPITCGKNKWEFDQGYLDFSSGTPVAVEHKVPDTTDQFSFMYLNIYRGDSSGHALYNINHFDTEICDTSFNILDRLPGSDYTADIPCPSGGNKYCLVTTDQKDTVYYTIIKAVNGTVTEVPGKRLNYVLLSDSVKYEYQYSVIPNCDGTKYWLVFFLNNGTFMIYEFNDQDTIIYHSTYSVPAMRNLGEYIYQATSPDGRKIAVTIGQGGTLPNYVFILDFDKSTGNITSEYSFTQGTSTYPSLNYSNGNICFSPNSRFLYTTGICCSSPTGNTNNIYQFDMYNPDPWANRRVVANYSYNQTGSSQGPAAGLALGPDEKVYVGWLTSPGNLAQAYRLSVINYPDTLESGLGSTGFNFNGPSGTPPSLPNSSEFSSVGFLMFCDVPDAYGCPLGPNAAPTFTNFSVNCNTYHFFSDNCYSHLWNFGDTSSGTTDTSTQNDPMHTFSGAGNYLVTMIANGDTITDSINIAGPDIELASSILTNCSNVHGNYSIATVQPGVNYSWTITNGSGSLPSGTNIDVFWNNGDTTGSIKVVATDTVTGCTDSLVTSVKIAVTDSTGHYLTPAGNVASCAGGAILLTADSEGVSSYAWYSNDTVIANASSFSYLASLPGAYYVKVHSDSGCQIISNTVYVNFLDSVTITITGNLDSACVGDTDLYYVSYNPQATYEWAVTGGSIISGAGSDSIHINWNSATDADITVRMVVHSVNDSCVSGNVQKLTVASCTSGISLLQDIGNIDIIPNPARESFTVTSSQIIDGKVELILTDALGQRLMQNTSASSNEKINITIDVRNLAAGIYFVTLKAADEMVTKKVVKY